MKVAISRVDASSFRPAPDLSEGASAAGRPLRVSFVGRLVAVKALPLLLAAMARLREQGCAIQLDVVGEGPMAADWCAEAQALGLARRVCWHGARSAPEVAAVMRGSDVFCLPSVRESGGAVLLEAMACGVPVIGMDFGGPAEIVDAEVGWKVPMPDATTAIDGLVQALREAHDDPAARLRRGRAARARVLDRHTCAARMTAAEALYARLLSGA